MPAELEGHAVGAGELQVRQHGFDLFGQCAGERVARAVQRGQPVESRAAARGHIGRRAVDGVDVGLREFVEGQQLRHLARHLCVAGQGTVLGARKFEPAFDARQQRGQCDGAGGVEGKGFVHRVAVYQREVTVP